MFCCVCSTDKTNKESVRAIQKSIFLVCLDAPMPRASDEIYHSKVAAQMLHGGGSRWNSGNRWFDKTLQVCDEHIHTRAVQLYHWSTSWRVANDPQFILTEIQSEQSSLIQYNHGGIGIWIFLIFILNYNPRRIGARRDFYFEFPLVLWQESHGNIYYIYVRLHLQNNLLHNKPI